MQTRKLAETLQTGKECEYEELCFRRGLPLACVVMGIACSSFSCFVLRICNSGVIMNFVIVQYHDISGPWTFIIILAIMASLCCCFFLLPNFEDANSCYSDIVISFVVLYCFSG